MKKSVAYTTSIIFVSLLALTGCQSVMYKPDLDQGNYLELESAKTIEKGMTQEQVKFLLGTPITTDLFNKNRWIYLFRQVPSRQDLVQEQLVITFDEDGVVTEIAHQPRTTL